MSGIYRLNLFFLLFFSFSGFAQEYQINWKKESLFIPQRVDILSFKNAEFPLNQPIPFLILTEKTNSPLVAKIKNQNFTEILPEEMPLFFGDSLLKPEIGFKSQMGYSREKGFLTIEIFPFRKNKITGKNEKLISFEIEKENSAVRAGGQSYNRTYGPNSVLSSGQWFKIGIKEDGVYKINSAFLTSLGIDPNSIAPGNIRVFGNGGAMLPENNALPRADDLKEISIFVSGESDGSFNSDDYILFYGQSPHHWKLNGANFNHITNIYSDTTFYFITIGNTPGKRIPTINNQTLTPNYTSDGLDEYLFYEKDLYSIIISGKQWYGEKFDIVNRYNFDFNIPDAIGPINLRLNAAASLKGSASYFKLTAPQNYYTFKIKGKGSDPALSEFANFKDSIVPLNGINGNFQITLEYSKPEPSAQGWLNFFEFNARRSPVMKPGQMLFRDKYSYGSGKISQFNISGLSQGSWIWDITNHSEVANISYGLSSGNASFNIPTDTLKQFIAFDWTKFLTPAALGKIENQNLHALSQADLIIVAYDKYITEAQRLATFHKTKDNLSSHVIPVSKVFNEFSGGSQDPTAIKDLMIMFYYRDMATAPKYLLLFGDGSYDYKDRVPENTNRIPTYQSNESLRPLDSYTSDDYFGYLDSAEGSWTGQEKIDIGIGRIPVNTLNEAREAVDKIIGYSEKGLNSGSIDCNNGTQTISNNADWKNIVCFIADDEDGNTHIQQADNLSTKVDTGYSIYNIDKIYLDAYRQQYSAAGNTYPGVNDAINKRFEKGALVVNYTGHGGETGLAQERIISIPQILAWKNKKNLPLFITATCEFSRYDDPARRSAGELTFLSTEGGAIAMYTTVRLVLATPNFSLNSYIYNHIFTKMPDGSMPRLGDVFFMTKRDAGSTLNHRNFTLLGDPALRLAYPEHNIVFTSVKNNSDLNSGDTIKALSHVTVSGEIREQGTDGKLISGFNGTVFPTIYDKVLKTKTLRNDSGAQGSFVMEFLLQKNILFKGKARVVNGAFNFSFIVPKDINLKYGNGRISAYAADEKSDGAGVNESIIIGGISSNFTIDNTGPEIDLYLNDKKFVYGGVTDQNPKLLSFLTDFSGINTAGIGIGHDLTAVIDNKTEETIVLNDYYEADLDNYQSGKILFPFNDLEEGKHLLNLKAWDVHNNSTESSIEFVVAKSAQLALTHVLNYPNPFTTNTTFMFEHNQSCQNLSVEIKIFTVSGKLIKTINSDFLSEGYRADHINWDGRDDFGDKIGKGVYLYKIKVKTELGFFSDKIEKLVILN